MTTPSNERLQEIATEYGEMAGKLDGALKDGPGAASAFYMSCSLGEIASMATELLASRTQEPAEWQVDAALAAYQAAYPDGTSRAGEQGMRAALRAASIPTQPGVRPLEWNSYGEARGAFAKYTVYETGDGWNAVCYPYEDSHFRIAEKASEEEARATADVHHAQRILSALTPASTNGGEAVPVAAMDGEIAMLFVGLRRNASADNSLRLDRLEALYTSPPTVPGEVMDEEFSVTIRPTRTGFKHPHDDGKMLRLWVGQTNRGQSMSMLSYGFYCSGSLEGMDYTPVDASELADVPMDITARIAAVNSLTAALTKAGERDEH